MNLVSILLGILPESVFFTLFIIFAKQLKKRRITLFLMIFTLDVITGWLFAFTIYYHLTFVIGTYIALYLLYRSQIIDMFLITSASLVLAVFGYLCFYGISNYEVAFVANRISILLFLFIIHGKLNAFYSEYKKIWNRTENAKIKSITVRNVSCVAFNILIFILSLSIAAHMIAIGR